MGVIMMNEEQYGGAPYKELTGTLTSGSTTLTITDSAITTTATYDFYADVFGLSPTAISLSTGSITLTFEAQQSNVTVKVRVS